MNNECPKCNLPLTLVKTKIQYDLKLNQYVDYILYKCDNLHYSYIATPIREK